MLRYLLDTSLCVHVIRGKDPLLLGKFNRHAEQICISTIVLAELRYGAENSTRVAQNLDAIEKFTARLAILMFDDAAACHFGRIKLALKGTPIGPLDTLIAAHARSADLIVVTDNVGEFARVPDLRVENWLR